MLQGPSKGDLVLPIAGYNPMGGEWVLSKIEALQAIDAEELMAQTLHTLNESFPESFREITVVLNLADDVGGAWSQRYLTDYSSKFDIAPLVKRQFCTPFLWTSEIFSETLITHRTKAYALRTQYWMTHGKPLSLSAIVRQEVQVSRQCQNESPVDASIDIEWLHTYFSKHQDTEDYSIIFNFLYGDEASEVFAYQTYGIPKNGGLAYIQFLCNS